ncbi:MAG: hypothetical protein P1P88_03825 [Bacteroidales bacterium]|nr:hypothetical protein [Bacteroidales bacterium]
MKSLTGGGICAYGESLYRCTVSFDGGSSYTGYACGFSSYDAAHRASAEILSQVPDASYSVGC